MFRYHRILYRRLLRGQSEPDLLRLRRESGMFPTLAELIEDELKRRSGERRRIAEEASRSLRGPVQAAPS